MFRRHMPKVMIDDIHQSVTTPKFHQVQTSEGQKQVIEDYNGIDSYPALEDFTLQVQLESGIPLKEIPLPEINSADTLETLSNELNNSLNYGD